MKTVISFVAISLVVSLAYAKTDQAKKMTVREPTASWLKELSPDSARILEVLAASCPEKLTELMQDANAVGKVFYGERVEGKSTKRMWQITGVRREPPPFMSESPIATLVIDWQTKPQSGPSAPDRGPEWEIKCTMQRQ